MRLKKNLLTVYSLLGIMAFSGAVYADSANAAAATDGQLKSYLCAVKPLALAMGIQGTSTEFA